jgi:hypothetical protein
MTLEQALREAAAKGLTHVTMWPVPSQDRKTTYWYARATPSTAHSYVQTQNVDPVAALTAVLESLPKAPKRVAKKVTATVTDEEIVAIQAETHATEAEAEDKPKARKTGGLNPEWGI